jgi:transcriptional regulator with XRE-family HTH domain
MDVGTPLGDFIRARRDATTPESVGVTSSGRRRAPGLRRTELATLAGISVEYLTRIEQGRDRNPSVQVVSAIADALRLDIEEQEHLRNVTKASSGECVGPRAPSTVVRPAVRAILDQLEPGIAAVTNRLGDILASTDGFDRLTRPLGLLDDPAPNLTRFVFTDERARQVFPEWGRVADQRAFELWRGPSTERAAAFTAELSDAAGAEFTRRLNRQAVPRGGPQQWLHPYVGELRLECEALELPAADGQQLMVLLPADEATAAALDSLHRTATGSLRAVQ